MFSCISKVVNTIHNCKSMQFSTKSVNKFQNDRKNYSKQLMNMNCVKSVDVHICKRLWRISSY